MVNVQMQKKERREQLMCQRVKTREEIANQFYLSKADIQKLLGVSYATSKRIYDYAKKEDEKDLNGFIIEPTKVRITSVCRVTKTTLATIHKQVGAVANGA